VSPAYGMDPEEVRRLATLLQGSAERLDAIRAEFEGLLRGLRWIGSDADQLQSMWSTTGRRAIGQAAYCLREAGTQLRTEAAQQDRASAADAGASTVTVDGGSPPQSWFNQGRAVLGQLRDSLDGSGYTALSTLIGAATVLGTVDKTITGAAGFFKYNTSRLLFDNPFLKRLDETPVMRGLGKFDLALTAVERGTDIYHAFLDPGQNATAAEKIDAVGSTAASGLKAYGTNAGNPVAYLAGVATASWTEAASAATQVDWSVNGMKELGDAVVHQPGMVVDELGKAAKEVFTKKIWDILG
jgi:hypothetical protein